MNDQEERLVKRVLGHAALFFVTDFLIDFPNAQIYLVGGAVRDALLRRPMQEADFDLVVTGLPSDKLENWFKQRGEIDLVGQRFGVYKFMPKGFSPQELPSIDIALPRTEAVAEGSLGGYRDFDIQADPNLPIEADLARRDFTMNAIAFELRSNTLIDPFNGRVDLSEKRVRAVGTAVERFTEDLSRMLRGIRFASELGFQIEETTSQAIVALADRLNLQREKGDSLEFVVPRETIGTELAKAFSRNPENALEQMRQHRMIEVLFPEVHRLLQQDSSYLTPITQTKPGELAVVLSLILRGLSHDQVLEALHFSGLDTLPREHAGQTKTQQIIWLIDRVQESLSPAEVLAMPASVFEKTYMNSKGFALMRCLELLERKELAQTAKKRRSEIEERWLVDHDESIAPLISGQDILAQGIRPGPEVRIWLERVRDLQLDGSLMRREQALTWLEQQLKQKSPG